MEYTKPCLTFDEQADLLIDDRHLIANRDDLISKLSRVGYYRLSGYWHLYKKCVRLEGYEGDESFVEGTSFERIWDLYRFDRRLRLVVFDAIERIEVYMRTRLAYELSSTLDGPFAFNNPKNLPGLNSKDYDGFIRKCRDEYNRSHETFVTHFKDVYGDVHQLPPYWILVQIMDFGMLLTLYQGAPKSRQSVIAEPFDVPPSVFKSWLKSLNAVRNICAHHGRLWNRVLGLRPKIPEWDAMSAARNLRKEQKKIWHDPVEVANDRLFGILTVVSHMLEQMAPYTQWRERLLELLRDRSSDDLRSMGFISGWEACPIWKPWIPSWWHSRSMT